MSLTPQIRFDPLRYFRLVTTMTQQNVGEKQMK